MAANGNDNNPHRIIRCVYTGNEIPEMRRLRVPGWPDEEEEIILPRVTHLSVLLTITVIPSRLFFGHRNLVELDCHENVKKIESDSFLGCPRLKRAFMRGVEEVERHAFGRCETLEKVKFGPSLEKIKGRAFESCPSLEQIIIPLKNDLFPYDSTFSGCMNLRRVTLVEEGALEDTVNALHWEGWKNDMRRVIDQINHELPDANAGDSGEISPYEGEKTLVIRCWISSVLTTVIHYKKQHRKLLNYSVAPTLQDVLPNDIVLKNVLPFLELPFHTFDGEEDEGRE